MNILERFFTQPFLADPWMSATISLGVVAVTWFAFWFAFCVIAYRYHFLPAVFPEDPDIAYLVGHLSALLFTVAVSYFLLREYFTLVSFALGAALPLLWILFMIFKANAARRQAGAPVAAAATVGS